MKSHIPSVSSAMFVNDRQKKTLIANMSALNIKPFNRLNVDRHDLGLILDDATTRELSDWKLTAEVLIKEGAPDIAEWVFSPTPVSATQYPELAGYTLTVLNE